MIKEIKYFENISETKRVSIEPTRPSVVEFHVLSKGDYSRPYRTKAKSQQCHNTEFLSRLREKSSKISLKKGVPV